MELTMDDTPNTVRPRLARTLVCMIPMAIITMAYVAGAGRHNAALLEAAQVGDTRRAALAPSKGLRRS
jgi:hypothetical protein